MKPLDLKKESGQVVFVDKSKTYGYIARIGNVEPLYFHKNELEAFDVKVGDKVQFDLEYFHSTPMAIKVETIEL